MMWNAMLTIFFKTLVPIFINGEKGKEAERFGKIIPPKFNLRRKRKRRFKLVFPINYHPKSEGTEEKIKEAQFLSFIFSRFIMSSFL